MLTVYNIYSLHVLKFAHLWHKGLLPDVFLNTFQYASEVHSYNTRYATPAKNLYKPHVRTNTGKQIISFKAIDLWKSIPPWNLKDLNVYTSSKNIKIFFFTLRAIFKVTCPALEIKHYLSTCPSYLYYILLYYNFNFNFWRAPGNLLLPNQFQKWSYSVSLIGQKTIFLAN